MHKPENPTDYLQGQVDFINFFCAFWASKMPLLVPELRDDFLQAYHSLEKEPTGDYRVGLEESFTRICGEKEISSRQLGSRSFGSGRELNEAIG